MKRKHPIRNTVIIILTALIILFISVFTYYGIQGYILYKDATSKISIDEKIEEIQSRENFVEYSELPEFYINAVISVEDHRFKSHFGIDPIAITRAVFTDIKSMSLAQGGSTITQQLAKNVFFTQERKLERKFAEIFAAFYIEYHYSKEEIFELYVNTSYFGSGYFGIYDASIGYYGKEPKDLSNYEAAILAGTPNAPSVYSPDTNPELARKRANQVINSMVRYKLINEDEAIEIMASGLEE